MPRKSSPTIPPTDEFPVEISGVPLSEASTYQLAIEFSRTQTLEVGRLGRVTFKKGDYLYTGSAKRNMRARLRRHLSGHKTLHWHIDYLLASKYARVSGIELFKTPECALNQSVNAEIAFPGFGASDCRNGCVAHLKYLGQL